jgi:aerotolerance regulator-like protein
MLVAVSAFLIPIIIEWLFRKRKRQVELPTIRYLLRNKEQEKIRRQDRLLLLLRMLAMVLLALALARPLIRQGWVGGMRERNVIVLLDGTASMHQQAGVTTAFGWAQKKAAEMVRGLPKGTPVTVGFLGDRAGTVVGKRSGDTDDTYEHTHTVAARIEALRAGSGSAPMSRGIEWIQGVLDEQKKPETEIYVFSDFQKQTWLNPNVPAADVSAAIRKVAADNKLYLVDAGGEAKFNFLVTRLQPVEYAMSARMPVEFEATIKATGKVPEDAEARVTFLVRDMNAEGGEEEKKGVRTLAPGTDKATLRFEHTFPGPGEYLVKVVLEGDDHRIDNERHYISQVPENQRVLILDDTKLPDDTAATAKLAESTYLSRAIAPPWRAGMTKISRFATKTVHPSSIIFENLGDYVAVVLCGSEFLREEMASKLEQYVADGGALWLFMSDRVNPYNYNKLLYKDGKGLMPCALKSRTSPKTGPDGKSGLHYQFDESTHAALARLSDSEGSKEADVLRYVAFDLKTSDTEGGAVQVVLKMSDGTPSVVEKAYGRGKTLLANFAPIADWTYLPARTEFPVFVQEVLRYVVGNPDGAANLDVGDRFEQPVFVTNQHLLLRTPNGKRVRVEPKDPEKLGRGKIAGNAWVLQFSETNQQGLYEFDVDAQILARRRFVVNQSSQESDLARLEKDDVSNAFGSGGWQWIGFKTPLGDFMSKEHDVIRVAPAILWLLVAILAIESFFAARFGRRRGGSTA